MRIYDPRLGRFLSVDPLYKSFAMLTPYQFASNTPIAAVDLDGLEAKIITTSFYINENGTKIKRVKEEDVKNPYNIGRGVLKIDIKYKNEIPSSVESTVFDYTPQTLMSKAFDVSRWFGTKKNEFGFVLKGNSNGTSVDIGSDGVKFKEELDLTVLLKVMGAMRDVTDEKSSITDFMKNKYVKGYYNIIKSSMKIGDVMSPDDEKAKTKVGVIDLNSKLEPNAKICTGCGDLLPSTQDTGHFGLPGVRTDSNGKVIQQYKKNPETKKVDTTNN